VIIEEIKTRLKIEDLVGAVFTLTGRGRVLSTVEHDSLKLWPAQGRWWWFSQDIGGDVLDWHRHLHRCDLPTAIDALAHQAGIERRPPTPEEVTMRQAAHQQRQVLGLAAAWFAQQLHAPSGHSALTYCAGRGWTLETIQREQIGYNPPPHRAAPADAAALAPLAYTLRQAGLLDTPAARAVLTLPADMLVYAHRFCGAVVYLSARSIAGKRHWNLPADLVGEKQPYRNTRRTGQGAPAAHLLVEGQADAISLGQLGVEATAICGVNGLDGIGAVSHIALDADAAGRERALALALERDAGLPLVLWPGPAKDAALFVANGGNLAGLVKLLEASQPAIVHAAERVRGRKGDERKAAIRQLLDAYMMLEELSATDLKPTLCRASSIAIGQFNRLLAARKKESAEEKEEGERYAYSPGMSKGGIVFEQCVWWQAGAPQTNYAVRGTNGKIEQRASVTIGDTCYLPYRTTTGVIEQNVVLFPERPAEYGSVNELISAIQSFVRRYLDIDPFYERLAAYYALFTWLYDVFENVPYLRALGDYGTGKTRFLQVIGAICYRPILVSGATTVSPIFRLLHMFRGTLVIDEADFSNSDAEAEIVKILNVGYYRGGVVLRSEKDPNSDEYFPSVNQVYGPKILATRKLFTDRATESRCLTKRMTTRRPRPGIPYTLARSFWEEATALRNQLLMYRLRNWRPIDVAQTLADESVEPRLNQITMALKSLIDDPAMREQIDLFIRAYNDQMIGERQLTAPAVVLQAVCTIFWSSKANLLGEDERDLTMKGICAVANETLAEIDNEMKLTPRSVSQVLNEELGLVRRCQHSRTRRSMLLCDEAELVALMARYGVADPREETLR
jgi:hypothetical protein